MEIFTVDFSPYAYSRYEKAKLPFKQARYLGRTALVGAVAFVAAATMHYAPKAVKAALKDVAHPTAAQPYQSHDDKVRDIAEHSILGNNPEAARHLLDSYALQAVDNLDGKPHTYRYIMSPAFIELDGDNAIGSNPGLYDQIQVMKQDDYVLCANPSAAPQEVFTPLGRDNVKDTFASGTARIVSTGSLDQLPWPCTTVVNSHGTVLSEAK